MTRKSFGLLSAALVCAATVSLSISSCDSNNSPTTPGGNGGRGKTPEVLADGSRTLVGITETPEGDVTFQYDKDGNLVVGGLTNRNTRNAVGCGFVQPVNVWHLTLDARLADAEGALSVEAQDDAGNTEASIALRSEGNDYAVAPTFTSHTDGGDPLYDVFVYDNGTEVGRQDLVSIDEAVRITTPACTLNVTAVDWDVFKVDAQCIWKIKFNPCCLLTFRLPNGRVVSGNEIKFVERNSKGIYVYLETKKVIVKGNVSKYVVSNASAYKTL